MKPHSALAAALFGVVLAGPATAAEARIGVQTETSSIDPHYALVGANQVVAQHIFESLLGADAAMRPAPGLAASWRLVGDDAWEFKVRPGAKFHDSTLVPLDFPDNVWATRAGFAYTPRTQEGAMAALLRPAE